MSLYAKKNDWVRIDHSFGRQQPTLIHVGQEIEELLGKEN